MIEIARQSLETGTPMAELWEQYWRVRGAFDGVPSSGEHILRRPEIIQLFFHYWDFLEDERASVREDDIKRLRRFLGSWGESDSCLFGTASAAAGAWSEAD